MGGNLTPGHTPVPGEADTALSSTAIKALEVADAAAPVADAPKAADTAEPDVAQAADFDDRFTPDDGEPFSWLDPHPMFVIILVGPEEKPFGIQKDFLCAKCRYFRHYFGKEQDDAIEHLVKLPDTSVKVFSYTQHFLYTGHIVLPPSTRPDDDDDDDGGGDGRGGGGGGGDGDGFDDDDDDDDHRPNDSRHILSYQTLVGIWKLGHSLGIEGLCERALETMCAHKRAVGAIPDTPLLVQVWKETPQGSSIRQLLLSWAAEYLRSSPERSDFARSLPQELLSDLVVAMSAYGDVLSASSTVPVDGAGGGGGGGGGGNSRNKSMHYLSDGDGGSVASWSTDNPMDDTWNASTASAGGHHHHSHHPPPHNQGSHGGRAAGAAKAGAVGAAKAAAAATTSKSATTTPHRPIAKRPRYSSDSHHNLMGGNLPDYFFPDLLAAFYPPAVAPAAGGGSTAGGSGGGGGGGSSKKEARTALPTQRVVAKKRGQAKDLSAYTHNEKLKFCADLMTRMLSGPGFWTRLVGPFREPVDPVAEGLPDYLEKIKRPMDLGTIKRNLDRGRYKSEEEFAADVRQIFANVYTYWKKGDPVWGVCERLEKTFEEKYGQMSKWLRSNPI